MYFYTALKNLLNKPKIKIVVVGNCQSTPLAALFSGLNPNVEVTSIAIVHRLQTDQYDEYRVAFEQADFIVAQSVADNYPCEFVRGNFLKTHYGQKLIKILNLYYTGYTPDWGYIRTKDKKTIKGPMGDYHNYTIFDGWQAGLTVEDTVRRMEDLTYNQIYIHAAAESLQELQKREQTVDVAIVDYMVRQLSQDRLFFTMNHPAYKLLEEYAKRILYYCKIPIKNNSLTVKNEPLGQFRPRVNPVVATELFSDPYHYGIKFSATEPTPLITHNQRYTSTEIANLFYQLYEANKGQLSL